MKNSLFKAFSSLAAGALVSQVILFAFMPLLTRLYVPAEYGINSLFTSWSTIISVMVILRLDVPLGISRSQRERKSLLLIVCTNALGVMLFSSFIVALFGDSIAAFVGLGEAGILWAFVPGFALLPVQQIALQYLLSLSRYRTVSMVGAVRVLVQCLTQLGLGLGGAGSLGLVFGILASYATTLAYCAFVALGARRGRSRIWEALAPLPVLRNHWKYPVVALPAELLSIASVWILPSAIMVLYGPREAGFFAISNTVLGVSISLIGNSLRQAYLREGSIEFAETGSMRNSFGAAFRMLGLAAVGVAIAIWFLSPLLPIALGPRWGGVEVFPRLLIGSFFTRMLVVPVAATANIVGRQWIGLLMNALLLGGLLSAMGVAYVRGWGIEWFLSGISVVFLIVHCSFLPVLWRLASYQRRSHPGGVLR